jgi:hypothetical protein
MEAVTKHGRWLCALALAGAVLVGAVYGRSAPDHAVAPPAPTAPVAVARTRTVPCLARAVDIRLGGRDHGEPGLCDGATCLMPPDDTPIPRSATVDAEARPLAARIRLGDQPAACDGDRCAPLGRRLAAAAASEAVAAAPTLQATLDLSTAVVGRQLWSIARDAPVAPRRPDSEPNEKVLDLRVAGDLVVARWAGECPRLGGVDPDCQSSYLVDATGAVLDAIEAEDGLLRVGDAAVLALSAGWGLAVYHLHTGQHLAEVRFTSRFAVAAPLPDARDGRFAIRRAIDHGELLEVYELEWGQLFVASQHYYADCE